MKSSKVHIFHRMMETFHYHNITITVIVSSVCECRPVVSWGVEGKTIAGSEKKKNLSQKSLSLHSSLPRTPPLSHQSPCSCLSSPRSLVGSISVIKNTLELKESGLEKTVTLARHTLSLTALWALWHCKTGDTLTSNRYGE